MKMKLHIIVTLFSSVWLCCCSGLTQSLGGLPLNIDIPIDHFDELTNDTFANRFWINDTYYEAGGSVFIFDSGEQNAEPLLPYYLQEYHGLSATIRLAKRYHGLAILWEHRYYGASLPFAVNENTTAEEWQFLTTEQALEDVVFFANSFSTASSSSNPSVLTTFPSSSLVASNSSEDVFSLPIHPSTTPWIWLGGSYPGVRGAFMRIRNPEVIYAAWASSAPVQAMVDMSSYYKAAERSLARNCSADWVAVTKFVDDTLSGTNETAITEMKFNLLRARLSGPGGNTTGADGLTREEAAGRSNVNIAGILMDPLNFYQYYGYEASVKPFCEILETQNSTSDAFERGLVGKFGIQTAFDSFLVALAETDYDSVPGSPDDPVTDRSWMRQYCSEYGFYQRGDPANQLSIQTKFISLDLFQRQCDETFPDLAGRGGPQVENVNKYGGWEMNPSNVLFTNGEFDPWRTMGLASIESESPHRVPSPAVPTCNIPPANSSEFFGLTHSSMVHVTDLRVLLTPDANHTDFKTVGFYSPVAKEPFYAGLGLFELALDEWLPYFNGTG